MTERGAMLICFVAAGLAVPTGAAAQTPDAPPESGSELTWAPHRRVGITEYAITLGTPVMLRLTGFALTEPSSARLGGGVLFDDDVRSAFVLETRSAREGAAQFSDISWLSSMAYPFVDTLVVALWLRGSPDVAWQMLIVSAQSFSITAFVTEVTIHHAGRERPAQQECTLDPGYDETCNGRSSFKSLPSGHTAGSFAGAGLACAHHLNVPLYGGGAYDATACGVALAWASAGAVGRLMSDRHWATDVLLGAGVGLSLGWLLPELVYFIEIDRNAGSAERAAIMPLASPGALGLMGIGQW